MGCDHWRCRGAARSHQSIVSASPVMRSRRPVMNSACVPPPRAADARSRVAGCHPRPQSPDHGESAPGFVEASVVGSSLGLGLGLSVEAASCSAGGMPPMAVCSRLVLNQSTYSAVASSTSARVFQGAGLRIRCAGSPGTGGRDRVPGLYFRDARAPRAVLLPHLSRQARRGTHRRPPPRRGSQRANAGRSVLQGGGPCAGPAWACGLASVKGRGMADQAGAV
jgi:hypothetical protein